MCLATFDVLKQHVYIRAVMQGPDRGVLGGCWDTFMTHWHVRGVGGINYLMPMIPLKKEEIVPLKFMRLLIIIDYPCYFHVLLTQRTI